jgi:pantoate--beta-alanine ligase
VGRLAAGEPAGPVLAQALASLREAGFAPDYLALVEPASLQPWPDGQGGEARLLAAVKLGSVRLLDNMAVQVPGG